MNERKQLIRKIVLDILTRREHVQYEPSQFNHLAHGVVEVMIRRKVPVLEGRMPIDMYPEISQKEADMLREVFWDLVVEKIITIGSDASNPAFPWFKLHSECGNI
jgi:hypothetical protein